MLKTILLEKKNFPRENYTFPPACVTGVQRIERRVNDKCGATSLFAKQGLSRPLTNRFWQCSTPIGLKKSSNFLQVFGDKRHQPKAFFHNTTSTQTFNSCSRHFRVESYYFFSETEKKIGHVARVILVVGSSCVTCPFHRLGGIFCS